MLTIHNVPYALQRIRNIFKQQIRRPSCFSQSGNLKEESSSGVSEAKPVSCRGPALARKSATEQVEVGQVAGVDFSCVGIVFLLLPNVVDGAVAGVGVLVDLAVADTLETARAGQSGPEAADPREHIKIADQIFLHLHRFAAPTESRGRCHPRPRPAAARIFLLQRQIPPGPTPPG